MAMASIRSPSVSGVVRPPENATADKRVENLVTRLQLLRQQAICAMKADRFDDMRKTVRTFLQSYSFAGAELPSSERDLLDVAYTGTASNTRDGWKKLKKLEDGMAKDDWRLPHVKDYRKQIGKEQTEYCREAIGLIEDYLLPRSTSLECKLDLLVMESCFYRFAAEVNEGEQRDRMIKRAREIFSRCMILVRENARPFDEFRLCLALNYSRHLHEVFEDTEEAIVVAKNAFDEAWSSLQTGSVDEGEACLVTNLMQKIHSQMTNWKKERACSRKSLVETEESAGPAAAEKQLQRAHTRCSEVEADGPDKRRPRDSRASSREVTGEEYVACRRTPSSSLASSSEADEEVQNHLSVRGQESISSASNVSFIFSSV